jgi:hypothetical protein
MLKKMLLVSVAAVLLAFASGLMLTGCTDAPTRPDTVTIESQSDQPAGGGSGMKDRDPAARKVRRKTA